MGTDLEQQLNFLREIDRLKSVIRQSPLIDRSRRENSAEHSWHIAMYALILADRANAPVDLTRVLKMLLIHDLVEIDAGDTPIHQRSQACDQAEQEAAAARRIFGLLPTSQAEELHTLWLEFEQGESAEARFAKSIDRFQPLIHNIETQGGTWTENSVTEAQVLERYGPAIETGSSVLWRCARQFARQHFSET